MTEKIQIRQGPSGAFLEGTADNDVPLWDNVLKRWGAGTAPMSPAARLSNEFYVDQGSTAATPDGSMDAPFPTLQEGLNAIAALSLLSVVQATLFVATYDYEIEGPLTLDAGGMNNVTIQAGSFSPGAAFRGRGLATTSQVRIASLVVIDVGGVTLNGIYSGGEVNIDGTLTSEASILIDVVATNETTFLNCLLFEVDCSQAINIDGCQIGAGGELRTGSTQVEITSTMVGDAGAPGTCSIVFQGDPGIVSLDNFSIYLPGTTTPNFVLTNGDFSCPGVVPAAAGGAYVYYFRYSGTADGQFFAGPWEAASQSNEGNGTLLAGRAGTLKNLRVQCFNGVVSNAAVVFTVRIAGANTGITCTLNPGDTVGSDLVNTAALAAGDFLSMGVAGGVNANTPSFVKISFDLE